MEAHQKIVHPKTLKIHRTLWADSHVNVEAQARQKPQSFIWLLWSGARTSNFTGYFFYYSRILSESTQESSFLSDILLSRLNLSSYHGVCSRVGQPRSCSNTCGESTYCSDSKCVPHLSFFQDSAFTFTYKKYFDTLEHEQPTRQRSYHQKRTRLCLWNFEVEGGCRFKRFDVRDHCEA